MDISEYERLNPRYIVDLSNGEQLVYKTPNRDTFIRAETLFTKEPDTIKWLTRFSSHDVFVDIGANVGMYSIFAGKVPKCRVFAFEPESLNNAILNGNIVGNGLTGRILAFPIALSDEIKISKLYLDQAYAGGSGNSFHSQVDQQLRPYRHQLEQGSVAFPLDHLVQEQVLPSPTHVKVDVDGLEHQVVAGMRNQLAGQALKSVLVEVNTNLPEHTAIFGVFAEAGFTFSEEQANQARRSSGPFKGTGNVIFKR